MKSIKTKILSVVILGLLVMTASVSAIAVKMTHNVMHKDADRILNNVTQKESAYINDMLGDIEKSAKIMEHYAEAEIDDLQNLYEKEFVLNYFEKIKAMFLEVALNTNGVEGFFFCIDPKYVDKVVGYNIFITENSIINIELTKNSSSDMEIYYLAANAGEATWIEPYYLTNYDQQIISYTVPLYIDSHLLGVIGFDMNFEYLVKQIQSISVYDEGKAFLLSKDGKTNYSDNKIIESNNPYAKSTTTLLNGMQLELRADYKDIQHDIHPMLSKIVLAFVIVLFVSILYTIIVTNRIVRPLKQLTSAAEEMSLGAEGKQLEEISVNTKDEIGILSRVLNNTYEKIQNYTAYINALAYKDSLTGIKNSTAYIEAIETLNQKISANNAQFGVLVADINNLKQTNDEFGHATGNDLIIHTANILNNIFENSMVFRIGGDEFAIVISGNDYDQYQDLIIKLDNACQDDFITVNDKKIQLSIARGVSIFNADVDKTYEDVFEKADKEMYLNKQSKKTVLA